MLISLLNNVSVTSLPVARSGNQRATRPADRGEFAPHVAINQRPKVAGVIEEWRGGGSASRIDGDEVAARHAGDLAFQVEDGRAGDRPARIANGERSVLQGVAIRAVSQYGHATILVVASLDQDRIGRGIEG